jgi:hypothetical protein
MVEVETVILGHVGPGTIIPTCVTCNQKLIHVKTRVAYTMGHTLGHNVTKTCICKSSDAILSHAVNTFAKVLMLFCHMLSIQNNPTLETALNLRHDY